MRVVDAIGTVFALLIGVAALSLIIQPNGGFPQAVQAVTEGFANDVKAAKAVPS